MKDITYHGWIAVHRDGSRETFTVEYTEGESRVVKIVDSAAHAVEFWDKRVGESVKLQPLPVGAYRVYTGILP